MPLGEYIDVLTSELKRLNLEKPVYKRKEKEITKTKPTDKITYNEFCNTLNDKWISKSEDTTCVVDVSFPLNSAATRLKILSPNSFVSQANWLAIGYSLPGAVGVKCALVDKKAYPKVDKRVVVIVGDGAF